MPAAHVLFWPQDNNLEPAPFAVLGKSDPSDDASEEEEEIGAALSSQAVKKD